MTLSQFGIPLFQDKGYFSKVQDKESERVSILRRLQFGVEAGATTTTKANERERERELNRLLTIILEPSVAPRPLARSKTGRGLVWCREIGSALKTE